MNSSIAPKFKTRDLWVSLIKEHGPLTIGQLTKMLGKKPSGKSWDRLLLEGCIVSKMVDNPLEGSGCRPIVKAYEYVKDPKNKAGPLTDRYVKKAEQLLKRLGYTVIPPKLG